MNVRKQLYKKYRIEGYSKYTAARKAGYAHSTALSVKAKVEKGLNMDYWLEKAGLTDTFLAKHGEEGMKANKVVSAVIVGKDADEKTNDFIDVPDWSARHRYYDTILKLRGKLTNGHNLHVNVENHQHYANIQIGDLEGKSDRDLTDIILGRVNAGAVNQGTG